MGADPVMFSAVVPLSHSPKSDILPGLAFGGQVKKRTCLVTDWTLKTTSHYWLFLANLVPISKALSQSSGNTSCLRFAFSPASNRSPTTFE